MPTHLLTSSHLKHLEQMVARISTRISIKWGAEPASEPTDTLVLSLGGYYVDLRVAKIDNSIDWALAGQRIVVSEQLRKSRVVNVSSSQPGSDADLVYSQRE